MDLWTHGKEIANIMVHSMELKIKVSQTLPLIEIVLTNEFINDLTHI